MSSDRYRDLKGIRNHHNFRHFKKRYFTEGGNIIVEKCHPNTYHRLFYLLQAGVLEKEVEKFDFMEHTIEITHERGILILIKDQH